MKKLALLLSTLLFVLPGRAQNLYFPPTVGNAWDTLSPASQGFCQAQIDSLYAYLDSNQTKAFILLQDGKIVLEKYFGTHTVNTPWQWASAGKTITAFMTGIAQQEGYLYISDTTSQYLGAGWTTCTSAQEQKITVRHQLTMSSGLDDGVPDNYCTDDTCLVYKADAGTRWAYHNAPYTLIDSVLEVATATPLNTYINQKLKTPTGMNGSFFKIDYNNVFFSTARSMARFGLLILNKGNWDGTQVMTDTTYFHDMVNTSQAINQSYGYLWWLNGKSSFMVPQSQFVFPGPLAPHAPADMISAMGKDGQFLNVIPSKNMVWVRMGNSPDSLLVPFLMNDVIWEYVNQLTCTTSLAEHSSHEKVQVVSGEDRVTLRAAENIVGVEILDLQGRVVKDVMTSGNEVYVEMQDLPKGVYLLRVKFNNSKGWSGKFVR